MKAKFACINLYSHIPELFVGPFIFQRALSVSFAGHTCDIPGSLTLEQYIGATRTYSLHRAARGFNHWFRINPVLWLFIFAFKWAQALSSSRIILLLEKNDIEALFFPQTPRTGIRENFIGARWVSDSNGNGWLANLALKLQYRSSF